MSKQIGQPHVGRRTETRKNGIKYIYERTTQYDPKTKKVKVLGCKLIGKILPGQTQIIPTRPKKASNTKQQTSPQVSQVQAERKHVGATDIVQWVGTQSGIDKDLAASLPKEEALKAKAIGRYLVMEDGRTLPQIAEWQLTHESPYNGPISENVYGKLFEDIGTNEGWVQNYFIQRSSHLNVNPSLALDSTTVSTYSANQNEARYGFNKDHDGLPTIKLVTLYSVKDQQPVAYCKQPGNLPDVITIGNAIKQLSCLGVRRPMVVTDNGYYSEQNIAEFLRSNIKFLTLADLRVKWIRTEVDRLLPQLTAYSCVCPFDSKVRGETTMVQRSFSYKSKKSANADNADLSIKRRVYIHVFRNDDLRRSREEELFNSLEELKAQVKRQEPLSESAEKRAKKFLLVSRKGRGGKLHVSVNEQAYQQEMKYAGVFVLVSNKAQSCFEALTHYRLREKTEEAFALYKSHVDGAKPRVWTSDRLRGRQFVQFVALGYRSFLLKRIKEIKNDLEKTPENCSASDKRLRDQLRAWLNNRSLSQILKWFDCNERTTVISEVGMKRWTTENTKRDRLFLQMLGMKNF